MIEELQIIRISLKIKIFFIIFPATHFYVNKNNITIFIKQSNKVGSGRVWPRKEKVVFSKLNPVKTFVCPFLKKLQRRNEPYPQGRQPFSTFHAYSFSKCFHLLDPPCQFLVSLQTSNVRCLCQFFVIISQSSCINLLYYFMDHLL